MAQVVKSPDAFRTISEVSDILDEEPHVLRFWETKFTQIRPVKRSGGRRYYRTGDVALLAGIRFLLRDRGMTIKGTQRLLREKGVRYVAGLAPDAPFDPDLIVTDVPAPAQIVELDGHRPTRALVPAPRAADDTADLDVAEAAVSEHAPTPSGDVPMDASDDPLPPPADDAANAEQAQAETGNPRPAPARSAALPSCLTVDVPDDARLRLRPRPPRIEPEFARANRGAVRRHLVRLRDLRSRMEREMADREA